MGLFHQHKKLRKNNAETNITLKLLLVEEKSISEKYLILE